MEDEIDLGDYWFIIKKNLWLIIPVFFLILGGAAAYTYFTDPVFEARTLVVINSQDQTSALLGQGGAVKVDIATQTEIVRSAAVLGVVQSNIPGDYEIQVEAIKNSNVIQITAQAGTKFLCMDVADSVAQAFVNYTLSSRRQEAIAVSDFIGQQVLLYQSELEELNHALLELESKERTPEEDLMYQSLKQTIAAKEKLYNYLLSKREEVSISAQEQAGNIRIIEHAQMPLWPVKPNIPVNLALGVVLGLMGSFGLAFAKEYNRDRYRNQKDIEKDFGPVIMGRIPRTKPCSLNSEAKFYKMFSSKYKGYSLRERYAAVRKQQYLSINFKKDSEFAESMRKLRTNVRFHLKDTGMKLIAVTSAGKGEGKSTVAVNLALSLAQNDVKVLLVDANLRSPSLGSMFGKHEGLKGLSEVILGEATLRDVIKETKQDNLHVLVAGTDTASPPEMFGSNKMKKIAEDLRKMAYEIVIFDAPSLDYAEAAALAGDMQGTLFVVGHDRTRRAMAAEGLSALKKVGVVPFGVAVTYAK